MRCRYVQPQRQASRRLPSLPTNPILLTLTLARWDSSSKSLTALRRPCLHVKIELRWKADVPMTIVFQATTRRPVVTIPPYETNFGHRRDNRKSLSELDRWHYLIYSDRALSAVPRHTHSPFKIKSTYLKKRDARKRVSRCEISHTMRTRSSHSS